MSILKRRDRIVVFRVTAEELQQLQQACEISGTRNLSEFVRVELLHRVQSRKAARANMACLEKRLSELEASYTQAMKTAQPPGSQGTTHAGDRS